MWICVFGSLSMDSDGSDKPPHQRNPLTESLAGFVLDRCSRENL